MRGMQCTMMTVSEIVQAVGHTAFAEAIGVKPQAVSNMKAANRIPAKKYQLVRAVCAAHNLSEPDASIFSFDSGRAA